MEENRSRRKFIRNSLITLAGLGSAAWPGMLLAYSRHIRSKGEKLPASPGGVVAGSDQQVNGPAFENIIGRMGPVVRLADGQYVSIYGEGKSVEKPSNLPIPPRIFGRFSNNGQGDWSEPRVLFALPEGPGAEAKDSASGGGLPLVTKDGTLHIFGLRYYNLPQGTNVKASDFLKARAYLWHTSTVDGGKSWTPLLEIDYGHRYTGALNSVIQLRSGRILLPLSYLDAKRQTGLFVCETVYSDDGGETWRVSNDIPLGSGGRGLESGAVEPVVAQLDDGRVWMVIRTQTGYLFESFSKDGGATWSPARRTTFRASNAPAGVLHLKDRRLVLVWNNEFGPPFADGISYSRQSLVMVIHDGSNWKGYRELVTFGPDDLKNGQGGARYPYPFELGNGDVVVGYFESDRATREKEQTGSEGWKDFRLVRVDPRWLLETEAMEDFSQGIEHLQLADTSGVEVLTGPRGKPALRLRKPLADQPSGVSWNFPFGRKGKVTVRLRAEPGFGGVYFALSEIFHAPSNNGGGTFRWMIASDRKVMAQYVCDGPYLDTSVAEFGLGQNRKFQLEEGEIHEMAVEWDAEHNVANLELDGHYTATVVGLELAQGISYLHLFSAASQTDTNGLWVLSLHSESRT